MAPRAAQAETFAKAFLLAGEAEAAVMLNENPELTVLAVDHSGDLIVIGGEREGMHVH
jgi:thiamine biosynthesis lipoprotein ApbE